MFNFRSLSLFLVIAGLFASVALRVNAKPNASYAAQTIITRTPTSSPPTAVPPQPTSPPPPPPQATATATNTAVPTIPPTIKPTATRTPAIFLGVTAEPCGRPPTVWTISTANLRAGPGTGYEIVGNLRYNESRAILGRAKDTEWWLLPLTETETAWVANSAVTVQGDISGLPIVPAPPLDGATVTPAATTWEPTPNSACPTKTVTVTPSATAVPTTETATITSSATAVPVTKTATIAPPTATTIVPAKTAVEADKATITPAATIVTVETAVSANAAITPATAQPTAAPLDDGSETEKTAVSNFLLIGGGLLLLGGSLLLLLKRK